MNLLQFIDAHRNNTRTIQLLYSGLDQDDALWRPLGEDRWSLLEILCHLIDEEREDFSAAFRLILDKPDEPWPPAKPMEWMQTRGYRKRKLSDSLEEYRKIRSDSLAFLEEFSSAGEPDWTKAHTGKLPWNGSMRLGDVALSWIGHDYFHIRQISTVRWELMNHRNGGFSSEYAGDL